MEQKDLLGTSVHPTVNEDVKALVLEEIWPLLSESNECGDGRRGVVELTTLREEKTGDVSTAYRASQADSSRRESRGRPLGRRAAWRG
jgi:hypothetical protein